MSNKHEKFAILIVAIVVLWLAVAMLMPSLRPSLVYAEVYKQQLRFTFHSNTNDISAVYALLGDAESVRLALEPVVKGEQVDLVPALREFSPLPLELTRSRWSGRYFSQPLPAEYLVCTIDHPVMFVIQYTWPRIICKYVHPIT